MWGGRCSSGGRAGTQVGVRLHTFVDERSHDVQENLLGSIWTNMVQAYCSGEQRAGVKEKEERL